MPRLDATDLPAPGFVQSFCASQKLSEALAADRLSSANGQARTLPCNLSKLGPHSFGVLGSGAQAAYLKKKPRWLVYGVWQAEIVANKT